MRSDQARVLAERIHACVPGAPHAEVAITATKDDLLHWCRGGRFEGRDFTPLQQAEWLAEEVRTEWENWRGSAGLHAVFLSRFTPEPADQTAEWRAECGPPDPAWSKNLLADVAGRMRGKNTDAEWAAFRRECIRQALEDERNGVGTKFNGEFLANMRARHPEEVQELSA